MRKIVIGDICGEIDLLKALMEKISPEKDDYFLFTGSYLGPGKDSKGVMDYLIDFQTKYSCNFLKGCYEILFEQIIGESETGRQNRPLQFLWKTMGGDRVLKSYAVPDDYKVVVDKGKIIQFTMPFAIPELHIRFFEKNLHLWYLDHVYSFVVFHAGPDTKDFQNPKQESVILGEADWWNSKFQLAGLNIVFGHIPFKQPFRAPGKRGICLGAGQGGDKICAWSAGDDEFIVAQEKGSMVTVA
jgi:serine/threonine protein phosphatase 1